MQACFLLLLYLVQSKVSITNSQIVYPRRCRSAPKRYTNLPGSPVLTELSCNISLKLEEIRTIPRANASKYKALSLQNGNITYLPYFAFRVFSQLKSIKFMNYKLQRIHNDTFAGHYGLQILSLRYNCFEQIEGGWFHRFSNLRILDLSQNKLRKLGHGIFKGCKALITLRLSSNSLVKIENDSFEELDSLQFLDLSNQTSQAELVLTLEAIKTYIDKNTKIDISNNNLKCKCKMQWLYYFLINGVLTSGGKINLLLNTTSIAKCDNHPVNDKKFAQDALKSCQNKAGKSTSTQKPVTKITGPDVSTTQILQTKVKTTSNTVINKKVPTTQILQTKAKTTPNTVITQKASTSKILQTKAKTSSIKIFTEDKKEKEKDETVVISKGKLQNKISGLALFFILLGAAAILILALNGVYFLYGKWPALKYHKGNTDPSYDYKPGTENEYGGNGEDNGEDDNKVKNKENEDNKE